MDFLCLFASKTVFEGFDGFWQNRPIDIKYIGFWKFLRVNVAIFDILEPKRYRLWKYGFWRFFAVFSGFLGPKVKFQFFKIFKIGQKFDFPKMCLNYCQMSYKCGKWFFGPPKPFFCQYIMIFIHLTQSLKNEFLGQKSKFSWFLMLQIMRSGLIRDDQNF